MAIHGQRDLVPWGRENGWCDGDTDCNSTCAVDIEAAIVYLSPELELKTN